MQFDIAHINQGLMPYIVWNLKIKFMEFGHLHQLWISSSRNKVYPSHLSHGQWTWNKLYLNSEHPPLSSLIFPPITRDCFRGKLLCIFWFNQIIHPLSIHPNLLLEGVINEPSSFAVKVNICLIIALILYGFS